MELIRGLHNIRPRHLGCVATIGAFDGVHLGHQAVIKQLVEQAQLMHLPAVLITLEPLPREYFAPVKAPPRLMSFREKAIALSTTGIDRLLRIRFNRELSEVSAEDFIDKIFHQQLGLKHMIVGDDLRFGHERRGDFALLRRMGKELGFGVTATETCSLNHERVSSTRIRKALQQADFTLAAKLLGKPYAISGKVVFGEQLGRTLVAPTANLNLHRISTALKGVYAVEVIYQNRCYPGVANVGTRPTIKAGLKANLEVHLLDFNGDLYGQHLSVVFKKKLRDEKKFPSLLALKNAIQHDIAQAKEFFKS